MRLSAALAALLVTLPASAYERAQVNGNGPLLFWATREHSYQIDAQGIAGLSIQPEFDAVRVCCPVIGLRRTAPSRLFASWETEQIRTLSL